MQEQGPNRHDHSEDEDRPAPGDSALGDGRGFRIGYPEQAPDGVVAYDPLLPMRRGTSGARAIVGDLGRGKTVTVAGLGYPPSGGGGTSNEKGG